MPVLTPLDRLVVIAATKQQNLNRQIYLRKLRQPNALRHPCLFYNQRRSGFERNQQPAGHLESFRQTRFQSDHLLINRIDPHDTDQLRNQTLLACLRLESHSWTKVKNDRLASLKHLATRRHKITYLQKRRDLRTFGLLLVAL